MSTEAASALRTITFSITHPILGDQRLAEPQQIVDLVLHGICRHPAPDENGHHADPPAP